MTPSAYLDSLNARGVELIADSTAPSGVTVRAPRGMLTPKLAERIKSALPRILPLLKKEVPVKALPVEPPGQTLSPYEELVKLGTEVDALITPMEDAYRVLKMVRMIGEHGTDLPRIGPWVKSPYLTVPYPTGWFECILTYIERYEKNYGPYWWRDEPKGVALLEDLRQFTQWYWVK
ncbi:MAG: hypothetical protein QM758_10740 [Armatimonas sp.]